DRRANPAGTDIPGTRRFGGSQEICQHRNEHRFEQSGSDRSPETSHHGQPTLRGRGTRSAELLVGKHAMKRAPAAITSLSASLPLRQPPAERSFSLIPPNWNPVRNGRVLPHLRVIRIRLTRSLLIPCTN